MRLSILSASTLCILPFVAATTCDLSNALVWSSSGNSSDDSSSGTSSGTSSSDACVQQCGNDSACLQACYEVAQEGQCNSVGCPSDDDDSDGSGDDDSSGDDSDLIKRATDDTLDCSSSETCYLYSNGVLFCLDTSSGDFVDQYGGKGNMDSNVYTEPSGQVTTVPSDQSGSVATKSPATTKAQTTATSTAGTESSNTASGPASTTAAASAAATSTGSAAPNMEVSYTGSGIAVGALGLVVALFA